jgi:hypothetical protein
MVDSTAIVGFSTSQDVPGWSYHPGHLPNPQRRVRQPQQQIVAHHHVERAIRKRKRVSVSPHITHAVPRTPNLATVAGKGQFVNVQIETHQSARPARKRSNQLHYDRPSATANLEDVTRLSQTYLPIQPHPCGLGPPGLHGKPAVPFLRRHNRRHRRILPAFALHFLYAITGRIVVPPS